MTDIRRFLMSARGYAGMSEWIYIDNGGGILAVPRRQTVEEWIARNDAACKSVESASDTDPHMEHTVSRE